MIQSAVDRSAVALDIGPLFFLLNDYTATEWGERQSWIDWKLLAVNKRPIDEERWMAPGAVGSTWTVTGRFISNFQTCKWMLRSDTPTHFVALARDGTSVTWQAAPMAKDSADRRRCRCNFTAKGPQVKAKSVWLVVIIWFTQSSCWGVDAFLIEPLSLLNLCSDLIISSSVWRLFFVPHTCSRCGRLATQKRALGGRLSAGSFLIFIFSPPGIFPFEEQ